MSRTNIVIDDKLIKEARRLSGLKTKREIVDEALRKFVKLNRQKDFKKFFGKVKWEGSLKQMRQLR